MHNDERKTIFEQLTGARAETHEENFGNDGDVRAILNRGAAQRRLSDAIRPETD